ncbi:MAG: protoporphyrinogen oxidase [Opitutales bacterium]
MSKDRYVIQRSRPGQALGDFRVGIIGGGISALVTAHALSRAGAAVTLLERHERVGGAVGSVRAGGFLAEAGPHTLQVSAMEQLLFLGEVGLRDRVRLPFPEAKKRFILKGGRPLAVPGGPGGLLGTKLFSAGGKLRLLQEPTVKGRKDSAEESVAEFVRRRLGREVLDWAVNPFVAGVYAGDPERLSVRHAFPMLYNLEQQGGSLMRGGMKAAKTKDPGKLKALTVSFPEGLGELPAALAETLEGSVHTMATVERISRRNDRWEIGWTAKGEPGEDRFHALVLGTPAHVLEGLPLPPELKALLEPLTRIPYPPVSSYTFGFRREDVRHPLDGFGVLVPEREQRKVLGVLFPSSLYPGRAPEGCVTLAVFVGGTRQPELCAQPEAELRGMILEELQSLLGVAGEPLWEQSFQWPKAIPQYNLGYGQLISAVETAENRFPGLYFAGNYRDGIALGNCITNGLALGERIAGTARHS